MQAAHSSHLFCSSLYPSTRDSAFPTKQVLREQLRQEEMSGTNHSFVFGRVSRKVWERTSLGLLSYCLSFPHPVSPSHPKMEQPFWGHGGGRGSCKKEKKETQAGIPKAHARPGVGPGPILGTRECLMNPAFVYITMCQVFC